MIVPTLRTLAVMLVLISASFGSSVVEARTASQKTKLVAEAAPIDWSAKASSELEASRTEVAKPTSVKVDKTKNDAAQIAKALDDVTNLYVQPTAATVQAEVAVTQSVIERTSLRFTFLFEPYNPKGTATLASGQEITYSSLPTSVLGQLDIRWLPFELGEISGRTVTFGGYAAGGYARQEVPLLAPSGFRYDDVALNTFRFEAGLTSGIALAPRWNLEARFGAGQMSVVQTSRYAEVVGSFRRPYLIGALDLSYYVANRFALVASVARRSPFGDGSGSLGFDPLTVSGGFLVQVR